MNILVTGGAGFVGTNLIKRLLKEGHKVTSIDNYDSGTIENHQEGCSYHNFDIKKIKWFGSEYDIVYHLAALSRIQPSFEDPVSYFKSNVMGTVQVCELARRCNAKIIYAASSSAYGGPKLNPYAFAKYTAEEILTMYSKLYDISTVSARFFNV